MSDNIKILVTKHQLGHSGDHVLKFWMMDPGIVLQKLVIATTDLPRSYLGPPESYHRGVGTSTASRAAGVK